MNKTIAKILPKIIGQGLNTISYVAPKYATKKAMDLFATPRKGKILDNQKHFLNTAKQDVLKYQDLKIQTYHWQGTNDTILLVHGWESNSFRWKKIIEKLHKQDYNIIALDGPAHGQSGHTQFNAILYSEFINVVAKKHKPKTIIGHSVGGMASVVFQHKYQNQDLQKLILLGAPSELTKIFKNYVNLLGYNTRIEEGLNQWVMEYYNHPTSYYSTANFTLTVNVKGLIIHDKDDLIIPYDDALLIADHYKNATLITTKGFGHGLRDDSVNQSIIDFINH